MKNQNVFAKMVRVSNNSQITNLVFNKIDEWEEVDIRNFIQWLRIIEENIDTEVNSSKKDFGIIK